MLGLPKSTEVNKQLPKKAIYTKYKMNTAEKEKIDNDISRITIVNEVSTSKINFTEGEKVKSFFVLQVLLKRREFSEKTIVMLSSLIPQNLIMILQYEKEAKLAVYHSKLVQTEWKPLNELNIHLYGINYDEVWKNIVLEIGDMHLENGNSLEEQIELNFKKEKLIKEMEKLEKQARNEKQPRKKFELFTKIKEIKKDMEEI